MDDSESELNDDFLGALPKHGFIGQANKFSHEGAYEKVKFEVYKEFKNQSHWRLLTNKNQVVASGEGCPCKASCKNGIESVRKNAPKAEIKDLS